MSVAIALNQSEIKQISQPRQVSSSRLQNLARKIETLSVAVETKWNEFSAQERELLETLIKEIAFDFRLTKPVNLKSKLERVN
ncbi:MAG: hypothetical protein SAL07_10985 [Oscillatoria sp. PMC 1051.18]|nr:hypothetical protein [Oscillatoria sp. PMC 1050.18]MEC5030429.1 hypothetical protein [Oscillatoria sp. PMC 1051.18]